MTTLNHYTIVINGETCDEHAPGYSPEGALETYIDELGDPEAFLLDSNMDEIIVTDNATGESWRMSGGCHVEVTHNWVGLPR
mgnify:CR=1 FL=1